MSARAFKGAAVTAAKIVVASKNFRIASSSADRDARVRYRRRDKFAYSWVVEVEHPAEQTARPVLVAEENEFFAGLGRVLIKPAQCPLHSESDQIAAQ